MQKSGNLAMMDATCSIDIQTVKGVKGLAGIPVPAGAEKESALKSRQALRAAFLPAMRPKTMQSAMALPPRRLLPCTPPTNSPAA